MSLKIQFSFIIHLTKLFYVFIFYSAHKHWSGLPIKFNFRSNLFFSNKNYSYFECNKIKRYYLFISNLLLAELFDDCVRLGWMANNQAIGSFVRKQWHQVDVQQVSQLTQLDFLYFLDKLPFIQNFPFDETKFEI